LSSVKIEQQTQLPFEVIEVFFFKGKMVPTPLVQMLLALMRLSFTAFVAWNESNESRGSRGFVTCESF